MAERIECLCPALFAMPDKIAFFEDPGYVVHPDEENIVTLGDFGTNRLW